MDSGPNRVLVGLPDRLAKAKDQIDLYERRFKFIRNLINEPVSDLAKIATINGVCQGRYDDQL